MPRAACVALVDALLGGVGRCVGGASLHRPPGHHAEPAQAMGFCLFDNVAIGAQHALDAHGARRVMIFDWDVHHGNGTNAIFHERDDVLFCSIHQSPLYPGTGPASDVGRGAGEGFTVNMPVPAGSGDAVFLSHVEHVVAPLARAYAPDLLLRVGGLRRPRRRPAGVVPGHRRGLRRDGGADARDGRRARRAAGHRARGRLRPRRAGAVGGGDARGARRADGRWPSREVALHPLAARAQERLVAGHWPALA